MAATIEFMLGQLTACCVVFLVLRFGSIGAAVVFCLGKQSFWSPILQLAVTLIPDLCKNAK
jgi:hypothetical protein